MQRTKIQRGEIGVVSESLNPIILYDGVCGLCNRLVQFVLKRDQRDFFRFASLQSGFARNVVGRQGFKPDDLDTVYVVLNYDSPSERLVGKSEAIAYILKELGGAWAGMSAFRLIPRAVRDFAYDLVARFRYRVFGRYDSCPLPSPSDRAKFLDL